MNDSPATPLPGDRLAKVMARSGLCSRRDAEEWIRAGRVTVNGKKILTPAFNVAASDEVVVDGAPLGDRAGTRVWLYHKPRGLVVTEKDPEGRETVFDALATTGLPRVVSVGRLDINTEGLLLLTNDGGLKRVLELPATGWLRKYRVRAHGTVTQAQLDRLKAGTEVEGVKYGPIDATLERDQGANVWLEVALREGKNREIKNVLGALGLEVNRLIRISFGPFQLGDLPIGAVEAVKARVLKDQLGKRLADEADVDFDSEMPAAVAPARRPRIAAPTTEERQFGRGTHTVAVGQQRFRFTDRAEKTPAEMEEIRQARPRQDRPGRGSGDRGGRPLAPRAEAPEDTRRIHFDDGREPAVFEEKLYGKKPARGAGGKGPGAGAGGGAGRGPRAAGAGAGGAARSKDGGRGGYAGKGRAEASGDRPGAARSFGDKPARPRADGAAASAGRSFAGKPRRSAPVGDSPRPARAYKPRTEGGARPPRGAAAAGDAQRPARTYKPRAAGRCPRPARACRRAPKVTRRVPPSRLCAARRGRGPSAAEVRSQAGCWG